MNTVEELIDQLKSGDVAAQIEAATQLGELGERAWKAWFELGIVLRTAADLNLRSAVRSALLRIDPSKISVFEQLRLLDAEERSWHDYALTLKDDPAAATTAIRNWIETMEPDEGNEDLETIIGISKIGCLFPETIPDVVVAFLEQPPKREKLSRVLGMIGRERSEVVEQAMSLLDHGDSEVQKHAAEMLGEAGARSTWTIPRLLGKLSDEPDVEVEISIQTSLVCIASDSNEAVDSLVDAMLRGNHVTVLVYVLGDAANDNDYALERLSALLADEDPIVRENAANALFRVSRADTSKWIEIYRNAFRDSNVAVRRGAVFALCGAIKSHGQELVPLFREALFDPDDDTLRTRAANALEAMGPRARDAAPDLARLCEDSSEHVKRAARDALDAVTS
jgi:HEAT repeat protein